MAKLAQPSASTFEVGELAPAGTFVATCLDVLDQFGVERPKFENPNESEKIDVTRFLFGLRGQDGNIYKVQSYEFRISGSPKSNLFKFLTAWLGNPPKYGWDYCELKGQGAMITIAHKQNRDNTRTFASLNSIAPVIEQLKGEVLPLEAFPADQEPQAPVSAPQAQQQSVPAAHIPANVPPHGQYPQAVQPAQPQAPQLQAPQPAWNPAIAPQNPSNPF
ncbi:hypothetical protein [Pelagicoccus sp. SDUM812002]|uniref:hypothetical protein n=1 Tax=Pelagicoccus sp. SDUM812002 TaxID=3041266 RepID=UPI00280CB04B|nr:hypothetical protein [Pelagicoccus sp. SDUM812002]MDQ8188096.1 hypothetical protein [Pelagicoccus sp. SDUM812002]